MILSSDNVSTLAATAVDTTPASTGLQQVPLTLDPGKTKVLNDNWAQFLS